MGRSLIAEHRRKGPRCKLCARTPAGCALGNKDSYRFPSPLKRLSLVRHFSAANAVYSEARPTWLHCRKPCARQMPAPRAGRKFGALTDAAACRGHIIPSARRRGYTSSWQRTGLVSPPQSARNKAELPSSTTLQILDTMNFLDERAVQMPLRWLRQHSQCCVILHDFEGQMLLGSAQKTLSYNDEGIHTLERRYGRRRRSRAQA